MWSECSGTGRMSTPSPRTSLVSSTAPDDISSNDGNPFTDNEYIVEDVSATDGPATGVGADVDGAQSEVAEAQRALARGVARRTTLRRSARPTALTFNNAPNRTPSIASSTPTPTSILNLPSRATGSTSSLSQIRSQSPFRGPSGPSHPYGMYAQDVSVTRTPSIATSSTYTPSALSSSRAPQHPYQMYQQNVFAHPDDSPTSTLAPPLDYPSDAPQYHRRTGPDGEDQEIIGPDGHAEQLPPYTEHPQGLHKQILPQSSLPLPVNRSADAFASSQVLLPSPSNDQQSTMDRIEVNSDEPHPQLSKEEGPEKNRSEKSWRERRKTRFCGIPFWLCLLITAFVVVLMSVVGGLVGYFIDRERTQEAALVSRSAVDSLVGFQPY